MVGKVSKKNDKCAHLLKPVDTHCSEYIVIGTYDTYI